MRWIALRPNFICYFYHIIPICSSIKTINFICNSKASNSFLLDRIKASNCISDFNALKMVDTKFIDIGANLQDPMFSGFYNGKKKHESDISRVLDRARAKGVEKIIITSGSLEDLERALDICKTYDDKGGFLYTTVGVHPCMCNDFLTNEKYVNTSDEQHARSYLDELIKLAKANIKRIVAVGEMGLDFDRLEYCTKETQLKFFEFQMELVEQFKMPLFLHMRNATDETISILKKHCDKWKTAGGVCHSFTGSQDCLQKVLDLGLHVSINGCSLKTPGNLDNVKQIPLDKLLFETDSPWCGIKRTHSSFEHVKSKFETVNKSHLVDKHPECTLNIRNEPCNIRYVAEVVHSIAHSSMNFDEMCYRVWDNTIRLFTRIN